jgi:5-methylcytosine-specific restriction protein A
VKLAGLPQKLTTLDTTVGSPLPARDNYGQGRGGRPWRRKREAVLKRDQYLCQPCMRAQRVTVATQVDHITPQAEGGTEAMDNLQAICTECHDVKTKAETARGIAQRFGM